MALEDLRDIYWSTEQAERDLIPLALFAGRASLGDIQGMWNTARAMKAADVNTCAQAGQFVQENPEIVHAAGLHPSKSDLNTDSSAFGGKLWRLTNRVFSAPGGARIDPEMSEYLRHVMNQSRRIIVTSLRPVERYSPYSKVAWRRPKPRLVGPDIPVNPRWPFLQETRPVDTDGMDVLTAVDLLIPSQLPRQLREDVCQDAVLAVLEGEITVDDLKEPGASWLKNIFRRYRVKYGTVSLDAPPPWDPSGRTLAETLAAS